MSGRRRYTMSFDKEGRIWTCNARPVSLGRVRSIVRDIQKPCLQNSPAKRQKMLKPERWHATFDSDGRIIGFKNILKFIVLGGVDPSIRAEIWEYLLGCYATGSSAEHRWELRMARRERYKDLIKQCQMMHSSVGTGTLAYAVGSKVMDVRIMPKDPHKSKPNSQPSQDAAIETERHSNGGAEVARAYHKGCFSDKANMCVAEHIETAAYDSSNEYFSSRRELYEPEYIDSDSYFDFPSLPVTDLFGENHSVEEVEMQENNAMSQDKWIIDESMHSFQISNNIDLIVEEKPCITPPDIHVAKERRHAHSSRKTREKMLQPNNFQVEQGRTSVKFARLPDTQDIGTVHSSDEMVANEGKISDWLWTLHRIVVDVVRTDSHLEFYGDMKNVARMSDILAVYAWVDPDTGYCQGMSDLLSPFVVLYEDNADAFWCFEMLLRRMRQNFHMEGPTGVMRQLEALGRILELTDLEVFTHLSVIGAESLLFAFRMLLVLFRRELSFNEALCMWEMMWAADFNETTIRELEKSCLEPLMLHLPTHDVSERSLSTRGVDNKITKDPQTLQLKGGKPLPGYDALKSTFMNPFCRLISTNFWIRNYSWRISTLTLSPRRNVDDELAVFCVAAILIVNRTQILKQTRTMDDIIKMFNDNKLEINVKRCIRIAIKLRTKYFYKAYVKEISNDGQIRAEFKRQHNRVTASSIGFKTRYIPKKHGSPFLIALRLGNLFVVLLCLYITKAWNMN